MKKSLLLLLSLICTAATAQDIPITDLADLSNDKVYTLRTARAYLLYSESQAEYLCASTGTDIGYTVQNSQTPEQQFKIEEIDGSYYLYSVGAKKYVIGSGLFNDEPLMAINFEEVDNAEYPWKITIGRQCFNTQEANQQPTGLLVDGWMTTDEGNCFRIEEVVNNKLYDFAGFDTRNLLKLFYNAIQNGRNYPTMEEFEAAGIQASDIAFVRSHVRRAEIMSRANRLIPETYEERDLFLNLPMDVGSDGLGGYPNDKFAADVFSMWQYTNLFGSWNHSFFQAPGAWVDAAHRNGTKIMSGIAFFESWTGDGDATYSAMITQKDENGNFKYVKPVINCLMFFGADGINYNWEDDSFAENDIINFHKQLYKYATEVGFTDYNSTIYTSVSDLSTNPNALYGNSTGRTHSTMLNYANGDFSFKIGESVLAAEAAMGTSKDLYAGVWIVGMDRRWTALDGGDYSPENSNYDKLAAAAHRCGICLWGEHGQSRFMSYNSGDGAYDTQGNYQRLLERAMSGGNRNPATRPAITDADSKKINWEVDENGKLPLVDFAGIATWIPERSAIQGTLPFGTHFTLGNGDRYFYKGKKSYGSSWYNMGAQDIVPTYRWLRYKSGTTEVSKDIEVNYTHLDAYTGGSCIELTGAATATGTDIILYKTNLKAGAGAYAKVAVKTIKENKTTGLYLIIKTKGNDTWQEYAIDNVAGNSWEEKKFNLGGIAEGDVIESIGLRVKGNNDNYQLYVGKLEINDNNWVAPANVKDVVAEVKDETKGSMTVKLHWAVDATAKARADWGLLYNDEANIDHFEVLMKNGQDGKVALVGTTSQWATVVPNIRFESVNDTPVIGIRAVSTDLKTYSPIVWVEIPRAPQSELPDEVEEDSYGVSAMDPACEGANIARQQRYVESVKTTGAVQDLDYKADGPVKDGSQYANARNHTLKVAQGQTITMTIKCFDTTENHPGTTNPDGLRWCFAGGWLDLNGSGNFDHPLPIEEDPEGERLFFAGKLRDASPEFETEGLTFSFKVPEDAAPGASRLRIVFSDAWFAGMFLPTGLHAKGFTIDFNAEIEGTNPGRVPADTRDQGVANEPECADGSTAIDETAGEEVSKAVAGEKNITISNADKAWIYTIDGKLVEFVKEPVQVAAGKGTYLVKMQKGNVIRSAKVIVE